MARNSNQLFSGDARFVINGSSLQIRSPSSRHDEALYVCRANEGNKIQEDGSRQSLNLLAVGSGEQVHQSSSPQRLMLAEGELGGADTTTCLARLNSLLFGGRQQTVARLSSISIRIVGEYCHVCVAQAGKLVS